ncbi:MAG TPA: GMC oxidoreductase [Candidatus Dormibacteraeota bacterium]|nr:GMC oxidoreductase [Candidatus Dormibacteraeota bacterium]
MFVVVGSGPAGVACAHALLQRGAKVTMLDAGLDLESDRKAAVAGLRSTAPAQWSQQSLRFLHDGVSVEAGGIPLKMAYGSSFPYREPVPLPIAGDGTEGRPSYARGGLSNVWGASMMPFRTEDMTGWPITAADLEPHYRAVLELVPHSARKDLLADSFPLYGDSAGAVDGSAQAEALLHDLASAPTAMQFGASRLAVDPRCVRCGLCLYGCPYGYIYSSADTLDALRAHPGFMYRSGVVVERVSEAASHVELSGVTVDGETPFSMSVERAFLACGVFSTARIVLASVDAIGETVRAVDNCYFLLPLLRYRRQKDVKREALHTLAQVFLELRDEAIGPHTVHLQVYTYNELYRTQIRNMVGPLAPLAEAAMLGRLLLIQGYLHSDLSAGINLSLDPAGTLTMSADPNPRTQPALAALRRRLWSERGALRALPVSRAMRVGKPGRGFHTGGTFPMRARPHRLETDVEGRPHGFSRLHLVDSSVFPSLPATTITLSVMANAHRIGAAAVA